MGALKKQILFSKKDATTRFKLTSRFNTKLYLVLNTSTKSTVKESELLKKKKCWEVSVLKKTTIKSFSQNKDGTKLQKVLSLVVLTLQRVSLLMMINKFTCNTSILSTSKKIGKYLTCTIVAAIVYLLAKLLSVK